VIGFPSPQPPARPALRSTLVRLLIGAVPLLIAGAAASAQDSDRFARLDPTSRFAIEAMIDSANAEGLPGTDLRLKTLEGIEKKADSRAIAKAVQKKLGLLRTARAALGPAGAQEIVAAAAVLDEGAKPKQLAAFREQKKGQSLLEAFTVWADLIHRGVPGEDASSAITKLLQDGADGVTFHRLWNDVQADISQGLNPGAALQNRIRETPGRAPPKPAPEG
jgi:hypothetical protein